MADEKDKNDGQDKGNGKDQQAEQSVKGIPVSDLDIWFIVGVSKGTGKTLITGPKVEELQKFKEKHTRIASIEILIEALNTVMENTKPVQKKSSILRPSNIITGMLGRGGKIH